LAFNIIACGRLARVIHAGQKRIEYRPSVPHGAVAAVPVCAWHNRVSERIGGLLIADWPVQTLAKAATEFKTPANRLIAKPRGRWRLPGAPESQERNCAGLRL
jgi:hypothetical protein